MGPARLVWRTWWIPLALIATAAPAAAQQGSVQVSTATQIVAASDARRAGQRPFEPDLGLTLHQPAFRFGNLFVDLHAVRGGDGARLGTTAFGLRDVRRLGMTWSLTAGDSAFSPSLSAYNFTNLFAPQVSFAGGNLSGFGPRGSLSVTTGSVTAVRNIFGSDPQKLGQQLSQLQAKARPWSRAELFAHASRVRTGDTREYTSFVDAGSDAGAGLRVRPIPTVELSADAGVSRFRRRGSSEVEQNLTSLVGAKWTLSRGWIETNAQRFSPGYFAVVNTPYLDREGIFAAAEIELVAPLRVFGGMEAFRTNLDPERAAHAALAMPRGTSERAFAGARLHVGGRNFLTLRAEQGDRKARPTGRFGTTYDSDTGMTSVEFQTNVRAISAFAKVDRRENLDRANGTGTFTQQTASAQVFGNARRVQVFGSAMLIQQARQEGGQTFWQGGGGVQLQLPKRQLWIRTEGLFSRTDEWGADLDVPHELYTLGLTGQLTPRTAIAFDLMLDRAPQTTAGSGPWLTRSMIRLTHRVPTGAARVPAAAGIAPRRRGNGAILGVAFADWNGNGVRDPGEEALAGVPFLYSEAAAPGASARAAGSVPVTSGPDGEFAFVNVPQGRARVSLDLAAVPVDFDPPERTIQDTEARGRPKERLAFGLVPLGSVSGVVVQDSDNDGAPGPGDTPIDGAVLILDDGARSEQTRSGSFRFDAVRAGRHALALLPESLPEGTSIAGSAQMDVVLDRAQMHPEVTFLLKRETRPEIRKVFPPKVVAKAQRPAAPSSTPATAVASTTSAAPTRTGTRSRRRAPDVLPAPAAHVASRVAVSSTPAAAARPTVWYAIQLAATSDRGRAWQLVKSLHASGVEAYVSEDVDGLAKIRVGSYRSLAEAKDGLAAIRGRAADGFIAKIGAN